MADPARERARRPARSRPTSRGPAAIRRTARRPQRAETQRSRAAFTGRAVILAVALASVMLALALPLKVFVGQRQAISKLEQQTAQQQARVDALKAQQRTWNDPAYVAAQARERLHFVKPGETAYIVLGEPAPAAAADPDAPQQTRPVSRDPWYTQLWDSVRAADAPAPVQKALQKAAPKAGQPAGSAAQEPAATSSR